MITIIKLKSKNKVNKTINMYKIYKYKLQKKAHQFKRKVK